MYEENLKRFSNIIKIDQIEKKEVEDHNTKCVMNKLKSSYINEYFEVYECQICKKDNICISCRINCHSHDEDFDRKHKAKLIREVFDCYCHIKHHDLNEMMKKKDDEDDRHDKLPLNYYATDFKLKFFKIGFSEKYICEVCYSEKKNKEEFEEYFPENKNIYCNDEFHKDTRIFKYLQNIRSHDVSNFYNVFFKNTNIKIGKTETSFRKIFFRPLIQAHEKLKQECVTESFEARKALQIISIDYMDYFDVFKEITKFIPIAPSFKKEGPILEIFDMDYILKIFTIKINNQDFLYNYKCRLLELLIKIHIKTLSELKSKKIMYNGFYNTSPLHRMIFRESVAKFFKLIKIQEKDYLQLIELVYQTLLKSLDQDDIELSDPNDIFHIYYKLIKYLLSFYSNDPKFIQIIVPQVTSIKEKCSIIKFLPKLIKILFVAINDLHFINQFESKYYERVSKDDGIDYIKFSNIYNEKLVKLLLTINFEQRKEKPDDLFLELFDMLLCKRDDYIESLNSLFHSSKNYLSDALIQLCESNKTDENTLDFEDLFSEEEKLYLLDKQFQKDHEILFENLSQNKCTLDHLYLVNDHLYQKVYKTILKIFQLSGTTKKNLKQIWMFANGLFQNLVEINNYVFKLSENFTSPDRDNSENQHTFENIFSNLVNILSRMIEDNSFLSSFLLNEKSIRFPLIPLIIKPESYYLNFKSKLLSNLKKENYLVNLNHFFKSFHKDNFPNLSAELPEPHEIPELCFLSNLNLDIETFANTDENTNRLRINSEIVIKNIYNMLSMASENSFEKANYFVYGRLIQLNNNQFINLLFKKCFEVLVDMKSNDQCGVQITNDNHQESPYLRLIKSSQLVFINFTVLISKIINKITPTHNQFFLKKSNIVEVLIQLFNKSDLDKNESDNIEKQTIKDCPVILYMKPEDCIKIVKLFVDNFISYPYILHEKINYENPYLNIINDKITDNSSFKRQKIYNNHNKNSQTDNKEPIIDKENLIFTFIRYYPQYLIMWESSFGQNPRLLLKFYLKAILQPLVKLLYKIIYFDYIDEQDKIIAKYKIYVGVNIFLKSLKKLLEILLKSNLIKDEYCNLLKIFFKINDTYMQSYDMNVFFLKIISEIEEQITDFKTEKVDLHDVDEVLKIFNKFIQKLNFKYKAVSKSKKYKSDVCSETFGFLIKQYIKGSYGYLNLPKKLLVSEIMNKDFDSTDNDEMIKHNMLFIPLYLYSFYSQTGSKKISPEAILKNETSLSKKDHKISINNLKEVLLEIYEDPSKNFCLKLVNKIFGYNPNCFQHILVGLCQKYSLIKEQRLKIIPRVVILCQFSILEFSSLHPKEENIFITSFKRHLKFLSIMCKNQNDFYINFVSKFTIPIQQENTEYKTINFCDFIFNFKNIIIDNILYFLSNEDILLNLEIEDNRGLINKNNFFHKITKITFEMVSNLIQSNERILQKSSPCLMIYFQKHVEINVLEKLLKKLKDENKLKKFETLNNFLINFLNLISLFTFAGKPNDYEIINPNLILELLKDLWIYLINKFTNDEKSKKKMNNINSTRDTVKAKDFINCISINCSIIKENNFKLFYKIYIYFLNLSNYDDKYCRLIKNLRKYQMPHAVLNQDQIILKEILNFFDIYIRNVEILIKVDDNSLKFHEKDYKEFMQDTNIDMLENKAKKNYLLMINFPIEPEGLLLNKNDYENLRNDNNNVLLDHSKIWDNFNNLKIVLEIRSMMKHIASTENITNTNKIILFLINLIVNIRHKDVLNVSITLASITNILLIFSIFHPNSSSKIVNDLSFYVFILGLIQLIYLSICVGFFLMTDYFRYQSLNKNLKNDKKLNLKDYIQKYVPSTFYLILLNFIINSFAIFGGIFNFLYPMQLFAIFTIFETMRSVLLSVKLKYRQFLSTAILIIILILFYSTISIFFFKNNFDNPELDENSCSSLMHCFLFLISNGVRGGSGFGFPMKSLNENGYWSQFILEWLFYFSIMLILLNIINGVIVDTFQSLRTENELLNDKLENYCEMCCLSRVKFESNGIDFYYHKTNEHNIQDYYQFFLKIEKGSSPIQKIKSNFIYEHISNILNQSETNFLPIKMHFRFNKK